MPHNTHRCQIKRFWHRSRDVRELALLCTQTHMYKQINQTNYTSLSLSQTSAFLLPQSSISPTRCFLIAWVNLAPEQSRWSRLGHQVSNGGASMPNASQVNLACVLAYIVEGRYSPLLYYLLFSIKFWPYIYVRKCQCMSLKITPFEIMFKYKSNDIVLSDMH